jgi:hypothetical protein
LSNIEDEVPVPLRELRRIVVVKEQIVLAVLAKRAAVLALIFVIANKITSFPSSKLAS